MVMRLWPFQLLCWRKISPVFWANSLHSLQTDMRSRFVSGIKRRRTNEVNRLRRSRRNCRFDWSGSLFGFLSPSFPTSKIDKKSWWIEERHCWGGAWFGCLWNDYKGGEPISWQARSKSQDLCRINRLRVEGMMWQMARLKSTCVLSI